MCRVDVAPRRFATMQGGREHAGVLAGAVVVQRRGRPAGARQGAGARLVRRPVRTAFEIGLVETEPRQPARHRRDMRSEEHTSDPVTNAHLVCRLLLEKKKTKSKLPTSTNQLNHTT